MILGRVHLIEASDFVRYAAHYELKSDIATCARGRGRVWNGARGARGSILTYLRSVRVQPCMRPVFRVEACPVAMQPLWLLALM